MYVWKKRENNYKLYILWLLLLILGVLLCFVKGIDLGCFFSKLYKDLVFSILCIVFRRIGIVFFGYFVLFKCYICYVVFFKDKFFLFFLVFLFFFLFILIINFGFCGGFFC